MTEKSNPAQQSPPLVCTRPLCGRELCGPNCPDPNRNAAGGRTPIQALRDAAFSHSFDATHALAALESENMKLREAAGNAERGGDTVAEQPAVDRPEVLAEHGGDERREWHSPGAWLWPGERIVVQRAACGEVSSADSSNPNGTQVASPAAAIPTPREE